jgi:hypothetical protein
VKSAAAISFDWRPSRLLLGGAAIVCVLAVAAICLSDLALPGIAAAIVILAVVGAMPLYRYVHPHFVHIAGSELGWHLLDRSQRKIPALLQRHVSLGKFLQLHFLSEGRHRYFLLAPDNVDAPTRRRLHLLLARLAPA